MFNISLIGQNSSLNLTILEILNHQEQYNCSLLDFSDLEDLITDRFDKAIDALIADLTTVHDTPVHKIKHIRAAFPSIPIISIHYLNNVTIQQDFINAGVNAVLTHELSEDELLFSLDDLISSQRAVL